MRNSRILILLLFTIIGTLALSPLHVEANDPDAIDLDYNYGTQILTVTVTHSVGDPNSHYIATIEIRVNGVLNRTASYTNQDSTTGTTKTFPVPAEDGDVINAKAICSIAGQIQDEITVVAPTTSAPTTTAPGTTPSTEPTTSAPGTTPSTEPTTSTTTTEPSTPAPSDLPITAIILVAVVVLLVVAVAFRFMERN